MIKRIILFVLFIISFYTFLLGQAIDEYNYNDLKSAFTKLDKFIKDNPDSYFNVDARLRFAEISFLIDRLEFEKNPSNIKNLFLIPLKNYEIVENITENKKYIEASYYGQAFIRYFLIMNDYKANENLFFLFKKYRELYTLDSLSNYIPQVQLLLLHSYYKLNQDSLFFDLYKKIKIDTTNWFFVNYLYIWKNFRLERDREVIRKGIVFLDSIDIMKKYLSPDINIDSLNREVLILISRSISLLQNSGNFIENYKDKVYFPALAYFTGQSFIQYARKYKEGYNVLNFLIKNFADTPYYERALSIIKELGRFRDAATGEINFSSIDPTKYQFQTIEIRGIRLIPRINFYTKKEIFDLPIGIEKYKFKEEILTPYENTIK